LIMKNFDEYTVADISEDDVKTISELERIISAKVKQDIVLVAYKPNDNRI
jgi:hypothetical protein